MSVESTYTPPYPYTDDQYEYAQVIPFPDIVNNTNTAEKQTAEAVEKLGTLSCIKTLERAHDPISRMPRVRQIAKFAMMHGSYEMRITEPAAEKPSDPSLIAMFPGFSESPNAAAAREYHDSVAEVYPGSRIMSISTEGVSDYCQSMLEGKSFQRNLDQMAENRLLIMRRFAQDESVTLFGVSMGSKIATRMAMQNLETNQPYIGIDKLGFHDPAIITPDHIVKDMMLQFPGHVMRDMAAMFVKHPLLAARCMTGNKFPNPKRLLERVIAMSADVVHLVQGTDFEEIDIVTGNHQVAVAGGSHDPLLQPHMWKELERRYPDNVRMLIKPHTGHLSTIDAPQAARDMHTVLGQLPQRQLKQATS